MTIISDSYTIDESDSELLCIAFRGIRETAAGHVEDHGAVWIERTNVLWLADQLRACASMEPPLRWNLRNGGDDVSVYETGHEQEPYVNVKNIRRIGSRYEGKYWYGMGQPLALRLSKDLHAIG